MDLDLCYQQTDDGLMTTASAPPIRYVTINGASVAHWCPPDCPTCKKHGCSHKACGQEN